MPRLTIETPDCELRAMVLSKVPELDMAARFRCSIGTLRKRVAALKLSGPVTPDSAFDHLMGEQRFTECPRAIRDRGSPEILPVIHQQYSSYSGCSADI